MQRPHHRSLQRSTHHIPERLTRMVEAHPLSQFRWRIPTHEQRHHARPWRSLAESQEHTEGIHRARTLRKRDEPCDHAGRRQGVRFD